MQRLLQDLELQAVNPGLCSALGGWGSVAGKPLLASRSPATGALIAQVALCGDAEYEALLEESLRASAEWRSLSASARGEAIRAVGAAARERRRALATLVALETGMALREAEAEVQEVIDCAELTARIAPELDEAAPQEGKVERGYRQHWNPMGVVGVITNFDAPLSAWAKRAFPAAVCGNATIWKPSPKAPLCALAMQRLLVGEFARAGHPGAFSWFLPESMTQLSRFVRDSRMPMVAFSGSTFVGRQVAVKVADRFGHSLLELPGSNAAIVDSSADADAAVRAILAGATLMTGQRGTALRRVIAHRDVCEALAGELIEGYQRLEIGDPLEPGIDLGPLIDAAAAHAYQEALEQAQQQGGDILWGGRALERAGCFAEPALIRAENHWESVQQESPLPILYLIAYESFDEALALQNATTRPFSSTLFTGDMRQVARYLSGDGGEAETASINVDIGLRGSAGSRGPDGYSAADLRNTYMRRQVGAIAWSPAEPRPEAASA
jgi:aldehyde dehydrogenase (NAD+)